VLRSLHRRRPVVGVRAAVARRLLRWAEIVMGPSAFATWDEAELLEIPLVASRGTTDAERLGVVPKAMGEVLRVY